MIGVKIMLCPKCSEKTRVRAIYMNAEDGEKYRRHTCKNKNCGYRFYSAEFIVEDNEALWKQLEKSTKTR